MSKHNKQRNKNCLTVTREERGGRVSKGYRSQIYGDGSLTLGGRHTLQYTVDVLEIYIFD